MEPTGHVRAYCGTMNFLFVCLTKEARRWFSRSFASGARFLPTLTSSRSVPEGAATAGWGVVLNEFSCAVMLMAVSCWLNRVFIAAISANDVLSRALLWRKP
jgi:hypothetical protein